MLSGGQYVATAVLGTCAGGAGLSFSGSVHRITQEAARVLNAIG